jgi:hypothetical protein
MGSPSNQGFKEDLWNLHSDSTQDSHLSQPSTSSQSVTPKRMASTDITHYLESEVAKQFDTSKGKTLRSGKATFSEPVHAKKWTAAAKKEIANFNKKQIPETSEAVHPFKLH